jgi:hypothetical protein
MGLELVPPVKKQKYLLTASSRLVHLIFDVFFSIYESSVQLQRKTVNFFTDLCISATATT